jgi:anti-sigma factor RsiW
MSGLPDNEDFGFVPPERGEGAAFSDLPPSCRNARGQMRDYADGELDPTDRKVVESHVHGCRVCAVALARVEFETLRLRRAFSDSWAAATPPPGFARRTLARLLIESPELALSPVAGDAPLESERPQAGKSQPAPRDLARRVLARATAEILASEEAPRRASRARFAAVLAVSFAFVGAIVGAFWGSVVELQAHVRLAVVRAERGWREVGRDLLELNPGDGLSEGAVLRLHEEGTADVEWYDASVIGEQPAAQIKLLGDTELRVDGQLELVHGSMEVMSHRPMSVLLGDGSTLELGSGLYHVTVTEQQGPFDALLTDGLGLGVRVEVERGDAARLDRESGNAAVVSVGQVGRYGRGALGIAVENRPSTVAPIGALAAGPRQNVAAEPQPDLVGIVVDPFGSPLAHAAVRMSFPTAAGLVSRVFDTDHAGNFIVMPGSGMLSGFALVEVQPPAGRSDLAFLPIDAYPLEAEDGRFVLRPIRLTSGVRIAGRVVAADGTARPFSRVVPSFYDEALGQIQPWMQGAVTADADGRFEIFGMPPLRGASRSVGLVAFHPDAEARFVPLSTVGAMGGEEVSLTLQSMASWTLRGLAPQRSYTVLEEVYGLPAGLGIRRHFVQSDDGGVARGLRCGRGRLWLEAGNGSRAMVQSIARLPNGIAEAGFEQMERSAALAALLAVPGVPGNSLELAVQNRFLRADPEPTVGEEAFVQSPVGGLLGGVQLFALKARVGSGPDARFLGMSRQGASVRVRFEPGESEVLAIDPNGALGLRASILSLRGGDAHGRLLPIALEPLGRAELAVALQPAQLSLSTVWSPLLAGPAGARPQIHRTLLRAEGWSAASLPPGEYLVQDQLQRSFRVRVIAGQTVTIR